MEGPGSEVQYRLSLHRSYVRCGSGQFHSISLPRMVARSASLVLFDLLLSYFDFYSQQTG